MARSGGFVLVATLWVLAGLAILASYIDGVTTDSVERATAARLAMQRELDRRNTEVTLVYMLATNRKNHRALVVDNEQRRRSIQSRGTPYTSPNRYQTPRRDEACGTDRDLGTGFLPGAPRERHTLGMSPDYTWV